MLSFILPTRNRPVHLARTLRALGELDPEALSRLGGAEVVVVDNASTPPAAAPVQLNNGLCVRLLHLSENRAAAARNAAARASRGDWLLMLDDDSHPLDADFVEALEQAPSDVAAIGGEIVLPSGAHEAGGLPEVFTGCGVAVRKDAFLNAQGYDARFVYYVEEYDLCAKLLLAGWRVTHDPRLRVVHEKTSQGRDMVAILRRLVRNNCWTIARYAPAGLRRRELLRTVRRYGAVALRERAELGWLWGVAELAPTLLRQPRQAMPQDLWDRFTGLAAAREGVAAHAKRLRGASVWIAARGKGAERVEQALREAGAARALRERDAEVLVVGSLSPGPAADALRTLQMREEQGEGRPVVALWSPFTGAERSARADRPLRVQAAAAALHTIGA